MSLRKAIFGPRSVDSIIDGFHTLSDQLAESAAHHEELVAHHNNQAQIHVGHAYIAGEEANRARRVSAKIEALTV